MIKGFILSFIFTAFSAGILAESKRTLPSHCIGTLPQGVDIKIELQLGEDGFYRIFEYSSRQKQMMYELHLFQDRTLGKQLFGNVTQVATRAGIVYPEYNSAKWEMSLPHRGRDTRERAGVLTLKFYKSHPSFPHHRYHEEYNVICDSGNNTLPPIYARPS